MTGIGRSASVGERARSGWEALRSSFGFLTGVAMALGLIVGFVLPSVDVSTDIPAFGFAEPDVARSLLETVATATVSVAGLAFSVTVGHGASTILMADAYPRSEFVGFDLHAASIEAARAAAEQAAVSDRVSFESAGAKDYPGSGYDLVAFFDCLHDMGDPVGALRHVRETIADDGAVMLVEPFAGDRLEDNLNPVGRLFYAASATICVPASRDQEVGLALGGQAGEKRLRKVAEQGGFSGFRRAAQTPFNLVFELRP